MEESSQNLLASTAQSHLNHPMNVTVYNSRLDNVRQLVMTPAVGWGDDGILGCSVRFVECSSANERVWHVLNITPDSPSEKASLVPEKDYIIASLDKILVEEDDFIFLIEKNPRQQLRFVVFNTDSGMCREVIVEPIVDAYGKGSIGCAIGFGALHRVPYAESDLIQLQKTSALAAVQTPRAAAASPTVPQPPSLSVEQAKIDEQLIESPVRTASQEADSGLGNVIVSPNESMSEEPAALLQNMPIVAAGSTASPSQEYALTGTASNAQAAHESLESLPMHAVVPQEAAQPVLQTQPQFIAQQISEMKLEESSPEQQQPQDLEAAVALSGRGVDITSKNSSFSALPETKQPEQQNQMLESSVYSAPHQNSPPVAVVPEAPNTSYSMPPQINTVESAAATLKHSIVSSQHESDRVNLNAKNESLYDNVNTKTEPKPAAIPQADPFGVAGANHSQPSLSFKNPVDFFDSLAASQPQSAPSTVETPAQNPQPNARSVAIDDFLKPQSAADFFASTSAPATHTEQPAAINLQ